MTTLTFSDYTVFAKENLLKSISFFNQTVEHVSVFINSTGTLHEKGDDNNFVTSVEMMTEVYKILASRNKLKEVA